MTKENNAYCPKCGAYIPVISGCCPACGDTGARKAEAVDFRRRVLSNGVEESGEIDLSPLTSKKKDVRFGVNKLWNAYIGAADFRLLYGGLGELTITIIGKIDGDDMHDDYMHAGRTIDGKIHRW